MKNSNDTIWEEKQVPGIFPGEYRHLLEPSGPVQACNGIALPFTQLK